MIASWPSKTRLESQLARRYCQTFSTGLSSGARDGSSTGVMFFGTFSLAVVCQPARPSSSTADAARHPDFVEVKLHGRSVGKRQRHGCSFAARRADGAEQACALIALVSGLPGPCATARPLPHDTGLLANSASLKPHLDGLALRQIGEVGV